MCFHFTESTEAIKDLRFRYTNCQSCIFMIIIKQLFFPQMI